MAQKSAQAGVSQNRVIKLILMSSIGVESLKIALKSKLQGTSF